MTTLKKIDPVDVLGRLAARCELEATRPANAPIRPRLLREASYYRTRQGELLEDPKSTPSPEARAILADLGDALQRDPDPLHLGEDEQIGLDCDDIIHAGYDGQAQWHDSLGVHLETRDKFRERCELIQSFSLGVLVVAACLAAACVFLFGAIELVQKTMR